MESIADVSELASAIALLWATAWTLRQIRKAIK